MSVFPRIFRLKSMTQLFQRTLLATLLSSFALRAESFDVPFPFHSAQQVFPAGHYEITPIPQTSGVYRLENSGAHKSMLVSFPRLMTNAGGRVAWLVFQCAQAPCRLSGVWSQANVDAARASDATRLVLVAASK